MRKLGIDEYKQIVLDMLIKIDRICRENQLCYSLAYGTLLGAVRHKGFIPWDDDVDIIMPRADYDKLRKLIESGDFGLNFICIETHKDTIYPYGKVCDTRTVMYEKNFKHVEGYGAFIDVFPYDYMPDDEQERKSYCQKYRKEILKITHASRTSYETTPSLITNLKKMGAFYLSRFLNVRQLIENMNNDFVKSNTKNSHYIGVPWDKPSCAFAKDKVYDVIDGIFEDHLFLIPRDYDGFLTICYGDYMKLPPEEQRVNKHQLECYIED